MYHSIVKNTELLYVIPKNNENGNQICEFIFGGKAVNVNNESEEVIIKIPKVISSNNIEICVNEDTNENYIKFNIGAREDGAFCEFVTKEKMSKEDLDLLNKTNIYK